MVAPRLALRKQEQKDQEQKQNKRTRCLGGHGRARDLQWRVWNVEHGMRERVNAGAE